MTRRKRRNHTASFKAKVAPAALRGDKTVAGRKKARYFSYPPRYFSYPHSDRQTHQDQSGRLWDVLFMAAHAARANAEAGPKLRFELYRVLRDGRSTEAELTTLKLIVGPGDDGERVMTTLLPNED